MRLQVAGAFPAVLARDHRGGLTAEAEEELTLEAEGGGTAWTCTPVGGKGAQPSQNLPLARPEGDTDFHTLTGQPGKTSQGGFL